MTTPSLEHCLLLQNAIDMKIYNVPSTKMLPSLFVYLQFLFTNSKSRLFMFFKLFSLSPSIFGSSSPFLVSFPMPPSFLFSPLFPVFLQTIFLFLGDEIRIIVS